MVPWEDQYNIFGKIKNVSKNGEEVWMVDRETPRDYYICNIIFNADD